MKWMLVIIQVLVFVLGLAGSALAGSELFSVERWNVVHSDNFMLFSIIVLLLLGIGVVETTTSLTREAKASGCSRRSITLQFLTSFFAVSLFILGLIFLFRPFELSGATGFLLSFGGSATIFGSACGLLLFGNYLYENPEKLK